ncbi:MAG: zinc metalloprotease HtpX [Desulfurococcales archaeon]|nr:zinc metalloprotease HtpX [Desulfurococcales archaeon]
MFAWLIAYWWLYLLESLIGAAVIGVLVLNADKLVGREPSSLSGLKAGMITTGLLTFLAYLALIVGVTRYLGYSGDVIVWTATVLSLGLILVQWLISPWLISAFYKTRDPRTPREEKVALLAERIARRSGLGRVRVKIADIDMPNAFAYGSPLSGSYIAVTRGLLHLLDDEEVEAVLGHEAGHLRHRDVSWILALSIIPLAVYFAGRLLLYAGLLGGGDEREGSSSAVLAAVGAALIAVSILFRFLIAHFNRLREYYADAHSALTIGTPRPLQRALAKIYLALKEGRGRVERHSFAEPLFIVAPLIEASGGMLVDIDYVVERLKYEEENPVIELFSTHPPISKRLRFLDKLAGEVY